MLERPNLEPESVKAAFHARPLGVWTGATPGYSLGSSELLVFRRWLPKNRSEKMSGDPVPTHFDRVRIEHEKWFTELEASLTRDTCPFCGEERELLECEYCHCRYCKDHIEPREHNCFGYPWKKI